MRAVVDVAARLLEPLVDIGRPETLGDREGERNAVENTWVQDLLSCVTVSAYQDGLSLALIRESHEHKIGPVSKYRLLNTRIIRNR